MLNVGSGSLDGEGIGRVPTIDYWPNSALQPAHPVGRGDEEGKIGVAISSVLSWQQCKFS